MKRVLVPLVLLGLLTACTPPDFLASAPAPVASPVKAVKKMSFAKQRVANIKAMTSCYTAVGSPFSSDIHIQRAKENKQTAACDRRFKKWTYRTPGALDIAVENDFGKAVRRAITESGGVEGSATVKSVSCKPRAASFDCVVRLSNGEGQTMTYIVPRNGKSYKVQPDPDAGPEGGE